MAAKKEEQAKKPEKKTCFVIMPFSDPEGYERGHFRSIYEYTFVPAIRAAGYEPLRIDDNSVSNLIHGKMMDELINATMVLCDLSTNNPNVLYELGIRHAYDKPVVLVQEMGQKRIFDIGSITSVEYHPTRLYEEVVEDQKKITKAILDTASEKKKYSIMSLVALQSATPTSGEAVTSGEQMEYLLREVSRMSRKVDGLEKKVIDMPASVEITKYNGSSHTPKEIRNESLKDIMDEIEFELIWEDPSRDQLDSWIERLDLKYDECLFDGVKKVDADRAEMILTRLREMRKKM